MSETLIEFTPITGGGWRLQWTREAGTARAEPEQADGDNRQACGRGWRTLKGLWLKENQIHSVRSFSLVVQSYSIRNNTDDNTKINLYFTDKIKNVLDIHRQMLEHHSEPSFYHFHWRILRGARYAGNPLRV